MDHELRIYGISAGGMDDWVDLFAGHVVPFHEAQGFRVRAAWRDDAKNHFVWIRDTGTEAEMADLTEKLTEPDFMTRVNAIGVTLVERRILKNVVAPRF
jgi:hypothetical protein